MQLFGSYGGMMRGGNTEATLVVADGPIEAPPTVGSAWSAILMHHDYAEPVLRRVRIGRVVLVNTQRVRRPAATGRDVDVVEVPATDWPSRSATS